MVVVSLDIRVHCRMFDSVLMRDATITAARQFVPCVVAGGLLTLALYRFAPQSLGLIPGLWDTASPWESSPRAPGCRGR